MLIRRLSGHSYVWNSRATPTENIDASFWPAIIYRYYCYCTSWNVSSRGWWRVRVTGGCAFSGEGWADECDPVGPRRHYAKEMVSSVIPGIPMAGGCRIRYILRNCFCKIVREQWTGSSQSRIKVWWMFGFIEKNIVHLSDKVAVWTISGHPALIAWRAFNLEAWFLKWEEIDKYVTRSVIQGPQV